MTFHMSAIRQEW